MAEEQDQAPPSSGPEPAPKQPKERTAHIDVPIGWESWKAIQDSGDPIGAVKARAIDRLRTDERYEDGELEWVEQDPMFQRSAHDGYYEAKSLADNKNRLPRYIRVTFHPPETVSRGFFGRLMGG